MIENKKGLSAIITTMLVVLLVLVAVGIVWAVVSGLLKSGTEDIEFSAKCLNVDVSASAVNCNVLTACAVTLTRTGTETGELGGVKLVFRDSTNSESSSVINVAGNIEALVGSIVTRDLTVDAPLVVAPDSLEVTPYFIDSSGNDKLCSTTTKEF